MKQSGPLHLYAIALVTMVVAPGAPAQSPDASPKQEVRSSDPALFADYPKPSADLPFLSYRDAWPARWSRQPNSMQGIIVEIENPILFPDGVRTGYANSIPPSHPDIAPFLDGKTDHESTELTFEQFGGFIYRFAKHQDGDPIPRGKKNTASAMFKFVSAQQASDHDKKRLVFERTWFAVYEPTETKDQAHPRGVALISPGLLGTPVGTLNALATTLRNNGWVVLRMLAQPSRFTEEVEFTLDASGDLEAQAKQIAAVTDNRAAECAYAVQAAFAHLEKNRPELKSLPRVAIGFSGGAMTLPTIIAVEPERYASAILVGGGADFWLMNQTSNYRDLIRAVKETWVGEKPSPAVLAKLDELYLRHAPLDAYHTAACLKDKKVLMIQGTADRAVPAPLGDLLWERLGKPERWLDEGAGHEALFMNLPREYYPKMMQWLDQAVPREAAAHAGSGQQPGNSP